MKRLLNFLLYEKICSILNISFAMDFLRSEFQAYNIFDSYGYIRMDAYGSYDDLYLVGAFKDEKTEIKMLFLYKNPINNDPDGNFYKIFSLEEFNTLIQLREKKDKLIRNNNIVPKYAEEITKTIENNLCDVLATVPDEEIEIFNSNLEKMKKYTC